MMFVSARQVYKNHFVLASRSSSKKHPVYVATRPRPLYEYHSLVGLRQAFACPDVCRYHHWELLLCLQSPTAASPCFMLFTAASGHYTACRWVKETWQTRNKGTNPFNDILALHIRRHTDMDTAQRVSWQLSCAAWLKIRAATTLVHPGSLVAPAAPCGWLPSEK